MAKRRQREVSRDLADRLIAAALAEADKTGWDALRLARIAEREGVALAEIHAMFASVDALADAWLDRAERRMVALAPALAELATKERIVRAIFGWLDELAPHRAVARQVLVGKLYPGHPHLVAGAVVRLSRTVQLLREVAGLHAPPPRRQIEEIVLTNLFVATILRWARDRSEGQDDTRRWLRRRLDALDGIAGYLPRILRQKPGSEPGTLR